MNRVQASAIAAMGMLLSAGALAQEWGSHLDLELKPGTDRSLGEADLFVPLLQEERWLLFSNLRARADDDSGREGNFGLGLRRMLENGWNLGGYSYFDRRKSGESGEYYSQVTLGAEALGRDWDLRGNIYLPQGDRTRELGTTTSGGASTASIVGTAVQVTTAGTTTTLWEEQALKGYDAEVGWRLPLFGVDDPWQMRVYAGGYHFEEDGVEVEGPRARVELTLDEPAFLWRGAQLTGSVETQNDDARGEQTYFALRLRVPLGASPDRQRPLSFQERRMTAPVVRDIDIVTQGRSVVTSSTPELVEMATETASGQALTVLDSATSGAALPGAVTAAGANSTVILAGTFNTSAAITTQSGQTLMGAGSLSVRTASGRTVELATPGATINNTDTTNNVGVINMADNSTVSGLTINRTYSPNMQNGYGIKADGVSGFTIANNRVTVNSTAGSVAQGIQIVGSSDVTISGNDVSATSNNQNSSGLVFANATNLTANGNTFSATQGSNTYAIFAAGTNTGITLSNNTIRASGSVQENTGLLLNGNTSGSVTGNTLIANQGGIGDNYAIRSASNSNLTISGNTLSASGSSGDNDIVRVSGGTLTASPGSTGNVRNGGTCTVTGTLVGTIGFTDSTSCP